MMNYHRSATAGPPALAEYKQNGVSRGREQHAQIPIHLDEVVFDIVAFAASAGGLSALSAVLSGLAAHFPAAIIIVQHLDPRHCSLKPIPLLHTNY